jgi:dipeptidyl aminopeptidase/acylaminoacyl peptidase
MIGALGPQWLGSTGALLFQVEDEGDVPLYRIAGTGGGAPARVVGGTRQVTAFSLSGDGATLAFTATYDTSPPEVFVCRADGTGERQLTDLNREWRAEVTLARPERFRFERAGFTIDGWVMAPLGREAGRRYPVLLNVHGGPTTQYGHRFFDEFLGGSYGGFMTSWVVGHTDRFRAACSERAVNAMWSMYGTSDIGSWFQEAHAVGRPPWDDLGWYLEHSPLSFAREIRTPLLIIHSEDDLRWPMEQAEQLYVALKKLKRPVRFVRFPGEDHELSRSGRPRHRLARFRILLEWFTEHLPTGPS